jgi:hypothetical protein
MAWPTIIYVYLDNNDPEGMARVARTLADVPMSPDGLPMKVCKYELKASGKIVVTLTEVAD